uniref:NADH-ubiquinone oxidoreductase chain 2 n=1 Tax=Neurothemis fulvia TaxID=342749 RepID=A0A7M4CII3_9ODON|nr:NADH dehydrogenase subunit 2 [Neurothemis fulvia]QOQ35064.1 NADH dehydrogenase subunit 2 [Neurothemis fulvia]
MLFNPSSLVFLMTLITGTMISISSTSWLGMWMGLEMNLLSFIPLINKNKSPYETEASMKYFLIQAMASILFLIAILSMEMCDFSMNNQSSYLICSALMMKMGAAPFHFWFPGVMEGIDWVNCFILMTWQKIAPFILISYKMINILTILVIFLSTLIGSAGGLNQNSVRKVMAYSSISHLGWMLSAMLISNSLWVIYFMVYSLMNMAVVYLFHSHSIHSISQSYFIKHNPALKFTMMISMLSLAGLPPFLGFMPKWLVIQNLAGQGYFFMLLWMVVSTLLTLYFYMRIMFASFMFMGQEVKWNLTKNSNELTSLTMMISMLGIPITTWMIL